MRNRFKLGLGAALLTGAWMVACGGDDETPESVDAAADAAPGTTSEDGAIPDALPDSRDDGGQKDAGSDSNDPADARPDVWGLPPGTIIDLTGTAESHVSVNLAWTSPPGTTSEYDVRYATTAITTEAEFLAATTATPPAPLPTGTLQTANVTGLTPETTYHFAVRAKDDQGKLGPISNDVAVTTSARARLLVSEIAPANTITEGGDFIELVATKAGSLAGLQVFMAYDTPAVHTFAPLDVAVGDRIVIHASGLPGPTNFVQEDETRDRLSSNATNASANAYDVYSAVADLPRHAGITIMDGEAYQDAVPYSIRTADDAFYNEYIGTFWATALASAAGEWPLSKEPLDYEDRCDFNRELVNGSGDSSPDCGGFPGFVVPGASIQRNGVVDTNTLGDFVTGPQTPGAANAPYCAAESAKLVVSEVNPRAGLIELNVLQGGRLRAFDLRTNPQDTVGLGAGTALLSLPDVCAVTGDVIVAHLGTTATPGETTAKNQHLRATYSAYYDSAWDFVTPNTLTFASSVVITIRNPANVFVDVAAFSDQTTATTGDYVASLRYVQAGGLWLPTDCGGALCGNSTTPTVRAVAADWSLLDATTGTSAKRAELAVPSQASRWSVGPSTFGQ